MNETDHENSIVFNAYKPFRNQIRKYNLFDCLFIIWGYSRNLTFDLPFPSIIEIPEGFVPNGDRNDRRSYGIPEFELEFFLKEFIINSDTLPTKHSLTKKKNLSNLVNYYRVHIRDYLDSEFSFGDNVLLSFNRMVHNQFKWQLGHNQNIIFRYFKIYSDPILSQIVEKQFSLTPLELFIIGFSMYRMSGNEFIIKPFNVETPMLTKKMFDTFIDNFSITIDQAREDMKACQQMNKNLLFSFNPLIAKPLIRINDKVMCPLQMLLFWQITDGLYYRIINEKGFENAYGKSFEKYIGQVISKVCNNPNIQVYEEQIYGKEEKRTTDWVIYDEKAILFIECKTKRITLLSKIELDITKGLKKDLAKMASFIYQIYKSYLDYRENKYPDLEFCESRIFVPLVLTLEDWYINMNFTIYSMLKEMVIAEFESNGLDINLINQYPYHIRSSSEFEKDIQIINEIGIYEYFEKTNKNELHEFVEKFNYNIPFADEFEDTFIKPMQAKTEGNSKLVS